MDREGFEEEMEKQRDRARAGAKTSSRGVGKSLFDEIREEQGATAFCGYVSERANTTITAVIVDDRRVASAPEGSEALLVLGETPYGEGAARSATGNHKRRASSGRVTDTIKIPATRRSTKAVVTRARPSA